MFASASAFPMNRQKEHHETTTTKCTMNTKRQLGFSLLLFVAIVAIVVKNQVHGHNAHPVWRSGLSMNRPSPSAAPRPRGRFNTPQAERAEAG